MSDGGNLCSGAGSTLHSRPQAPMLELVREHIHPGKEQPSSVFDSTEGVSTAFPGVFARGTRETSIRC